MIEYYVDACCKHQRGIFGWAVITPCHSYRGVVHRNKVHTFFGELFAVSRALMLAKKEDGDVVIYCDNDGVVKWLNKEEEHFLATFQNSRESELLCSTYYYLQDCQNVKIRKIGRKHNKIADKVAKNILQGECVSDE